MIFFEIFSGLVSICAFIGVGGMIFLTNKNISKILERSPELLFGYYSKLKMYLIEMKATLGQTDDTPLLALLSDSNRKSIPLDDESVKKLQGIADDIVEFFKTQDWQIPLDFDFERNLTNFLCEITYLESGNLTKCYSDEKSVEEKHGEIIGLIDKLVDTITNNQVEITQKAFRSQESLQSRMRKRHRLPSSRTTALPQNTTEENEEEQSE